jgi:integrase
LTVKLALRWATDSRGKRPLTTARRLEVLRTFFRYSQQFDADTEIPPRWLCGRAHRRLTPHIYADHEIRSLLHACLERLLLHIRRAKFGKERWVPVHASVAQELRRYAERRDRDALAAAAEAFFVFDYGRAASTRSVEYAFKLLRAALNWRARGGHPTPRIYDLRHSFICHRLEGWYAQGLDIDRSILALSTYVGHVKVTDTYWYVTATPELKAIAAQRFARGTEGVS